MSRLLSLAGALVLLLLISASCGSSEDSRAVLQGAAAGEQQSGGPMDGLPSLSELEQRSEAKGRVTSATSYNLLAGQPVMSNTGTIPSGELPPPAEVSLDPQGAAGDLAWAVYGLGGFPNDGSILPFIINSESDAGVWIALANFATGRWDFRLGEVSGDFSSGLSDAADLISPTGFVYVAVITDDELVNMTDLTLLLTGNLPGDPTVVINLLTAGELAEDASISFDAEGSSAGSGTFTSFTYDFGDFVSEDEVSVATAEEDVQWTYQFGGEFTVTVTARTADGRVASASIDIVVVAPRRELLVVYNENIQADIDLADYYADKITGRFIDPDYMLGLELEPAESHSETVSRAYFEDNILDPIRNYLNSPENVTIKSRCKYILLMKGIPHRIEGDGVSANTASSVDSELCMLNSYEDMVGDGWAVNGPSDAVNDLFQFAPEVHNVRQFYLAGDVDFDIGDFDVNFGGVVRPLDVLVGRITGYTYDDAIALIDRAKAADTSGSGWIVFDSSDGNFGDPPQPQSGFDTMVDQVWPYAGDIDSGQDLLLDAGFNVFADVTSERITTTSLLLPETFDNNLIGYCGWGVNHSGGGWNNGAEYILEDLGWNYLPGACFMSYESFNGTDFESGDGITRNGQGQLADFLSMGGTVGIGNAWEPFTIGVGDERWVFDRYINHGDRWIEAAYKGLRLLSWMEVVVGDPLCQVVAEE